MAKQLLRRRQLLKKNNMYQWIATTLLGIVVTASFAFTANSVQGQKDVIEKTANTAERVSRLEEAITTIKTDAAETKMAVSKTRDDVAETKGDVKAILRALK